MINLFKSKYNLTFLFLIVLLYLCFLLYIRIPDFKFVFTSDIDKVIDFNLIPFHNLYDELFMRGLDLSRYFMVRNIVKIVAFIILGILLFPISLILAQRYNYKKHITYIKTSAIFILIFESLNILLNQKVYINIDNIIYYVLGLFIAYKICGLISQFKIDFQSRKK